MNKATYSGSFLLGACLALTLLPAAAQGPAYSVTERGAFYRVRQATLSATNKVTGEVVQQVQSYTELGDGLNYLTNGQWAEAQDLIELTPSGAAAVHGQMTASFSRDITRAGAITLTTPSGLVFQSHPLGLYYADAVSGKVARLGSVQSSAGVLYRPNVLVFTNVLAGLNADLMLVWAKGGFQQSLVLNQAPPAPESFGFSNATCRVQFWSAMDACPAPLEQRPVRLRSGLIDNLLIFPDCWFPVGSASALMGSPLPAPGQAAQVPLSSPSGTDAIDTAKSLVSIAGQQVLIREVNYTNLLPAFNGLSQAAPPVSPRTVEPAARSQLLPSPGRAKPQDLPIQAASTPYLVRGVVLNGPQLSGSTNSYTFISGATYCISNSFTVGPGAATFQPNACLKFASGAWLLVSGPVSFPASGSNVVFTSVNDDAYGAVIINSTAMPDYAASRALWMYYQTNTSTIQNALFRWAQIGLEYNENGGVQNRPALRSAFFQDSLIGVYAYVPGDTLYLSGVSECNVVTPISSCLDCGSVSGSMTTNCVVSVALVNDPAQDSGDTDATHDINKNSESECTFILAHGSSTIVAAFSDTHLDEYGYGQNATNFPGIAAPRSTWWARSTDGGASFADANPLPPNPQTNAWTGDAPNPAMAYDPGYPTGPNGTVYLLANCSREPATWMGFRLWTSANLGRTFSLLNTNVPGGAWGISNVDRPMIKANTSTHDLYAAGLGTSGTNTGAFAAHSGNGGANWNLYQFFDVHATWCDIVITPGGAVYVTWVAYTNDATFTYFTNRLRYAWLVPGSNSWSGPEDFGITLNSQLQWGYRHALRFNGDTNTDYFLTPPFPRAAFANGHLYLVYSDLPYVGSTIDQGDIFLAEAAPNADGSLNLTGLLTVNNDHTQTDQWDPAIAAKPGGTELFIGYYSRQNDPASNSLITAYGALGNVANGLTKATFVCFPISTNSFPPLFNGTNAPASMQFDPVYPPSVGVCFDQYARAVCLPGAGRPACPTNSRYLVYNSNWFQDDNTWADADTNYFYYAWCDRSRTWTNSMTLTNTIYGQPRPDADVKIAKIRQ
ncbi:MAG TPA: hypothetical protein VN829_16550 [Dongiaceae bacterium]|nr:hypothetical protein [Dongiaceae bacterium]